MARPLAPSRGFLSRFSQSLRYDSPLSASLQCRQLSTLKPTVPLRRATETCLRPAPSSATRAFSSSRPSLKYKTVQEQRSRYRSGPFSWRAGVLFLGSGVGLIFYFRYEKDRMERKRLAEATKGYGKPQIGGPFELIDHNHQPFSSEDLKGKYSLVYFGFSHCPDICPEELDKMAHMIDIVRETGPKSAPPMVPVFITCDPARDTPAVLDTYLSDFHPDIIGLTGTWQQIKDVCKTYRVYFSTPDGVKPGQDYLVDHSIYFYLMDPDGDFVEVIGRQHSPSEGADIIKGHMGDWKNKNKDTA